MGRKVVVCYILILSYRKLLLAIIIFSLMNFPVLQTLCLLEMNLLYLAFILKHRPFSTRKELKLQFINEFVTMMAIYFLCLYAGDFIQNQNVKEGLGRSMVVMVLINFFIAIIVISFDSYKSIRQKCIKRKTDQKIK